MKKPAATLREDQDMHIVMENLISYIAGTCRFLIRIENLLVSFQKSRYLISTEKYYHSRATYTKKVNGTIINLILTIVI